MKYIKNNIKIQYSSDLYLNVSNTQNPITNGKAKSNEKLLVDVLKDNKPYLIIYTTTDCNKKCSYCFNNKNDKLSPLYPSYKIKDIIDFIISLQEEEISIRFFGGEPLLNLDYIKNFIREIEKTNVKVKYNIFTNGELLSYEIMKFLNKNKFKIYISLPGSDKELKEFENINILIHKELQKNKPIGRIVWSPDNNSSLKNLIMYSAELGYQMISFTLEWGRYDYKKYKKNIYRELDELATWYIENVINSDFNFIGLHPFSGYISKWLTGHYNSQACGCGDSVISISTNGKIYPCHAFNDNLDFLTGNIKDKKIKRIFKNTPLTKSKSCKKCEYKYFCKAKCYVDFYFHNNDLCYVNPFKCEYEKYIIFLSAKILYEISQSKNYEIYKFLIKKGTKNYDNN